MLDANRIADINELAQYGKTKGFLVAKRYKLPTYSNFIIIESEEDVKQLLDTYKEQNDFCMRSDTKVGNTSIGIGGQNGNRETILAYFRRVQQRSKELGVNGVAIVYWNNGRFCPTYETEGCFYLDFRTNHELVIDYIGKGWDGSCLSHGSACHETYSIPWDDILFLDEKNRRKYRQKVVSENEYDDLRKARVEELIRKGISREITESAIPMQYKGIDNEYFRKMIDKVVIPMYASKDLQRYYKEYIPIAQIEYGKILVPEVILPERLRFKEMSGVNEER